MVEELIVGGTTLAPTTTVLFHRKIYVPHLIILYMPTDRHAQCRRTSAVYWTVWHCYAVCSAADRTDFPFAMSFVGFVVSSSAAEVAGMLLGMMQVPVFTGLFE